MIQPIFYMFHKPAAFFKKDLKVATSYRLNFIMQFFGIFFSSTMFFMLSEMIGSENLPSLNNYGNNYFTFLIIGIALTEYFSIAIASFASGIRSAQVVGTLESLLVTPTSIITILLSTFLYNLLFTTIRIFLYFFIAVTLFNADMYFSNISAILSTFILVLLPFIGIGLLSAAFIIVLKQGSPISYLVSTTSGLLGGVFYPTQVLPDWLTPFSQILPITHGLEAMRQILINGAGFEDIYRQLIILLGFSVFFMVLGILSILLAVRIAKKEGSLLHY